TSEGNKRSYAITEEGRAHLDDNRAAVEATLERLGQFGRRMGELKQKFADFDEKLRRAPEGDRPMQGVVAELDGARQAVKAALRHAAHLDAETQRRAAAILERAAAEVRGLEGTKEEDEVDL